jgi:hypothetical protein
MRLLILAVCVLVVPSLAQAQTDPPKNPTKIEFACPDHDQDHDHELKVLRIEGGNKVIITTLLLGDPAASPDGIVRTSINVQPIAFGEYIARVNAVVKPATGSPLKSEDSPESNQFSRVPGSPSRVVIQ